MITTHELPREVFSALTSGDGIPAIVRHLREVQRSKHLMLLAAVARDVEGTDSGSPEAAAFRAGYRLLAAVQQASPETFAWLFELPHIGGWAHDCLARQDRGMRPDLGYLAAAAAAAAVRAGVRFELELPVTEGRVLLPGLGYFDGAGQDPWVLLRSDGERLTVGALAAVPCAALVTDDGSGEGEPVPRWHGTYAVHASAEGFIWQTLIETADRTLDRFMLPMYTTVTAAEVTEWRRCLQSAWQLLSRHHEWAAGQIAAGVSTVIPLLARSDTELESATAPATFGAIATSWPPDPVSMAETLIHESEHLKLGGLLDMVSLVKPSDDRVYAPWRPDPRPASGLLQGIYAHLAVARFWNTQRHVEAEPDSILHAQVVFERWRRMIGPTATALLRSGCLTPEGRQFVTMLREQGQRLEAEAVPAEAQAIARDVALDHWFTWQLRHAGIDASEVADLAVAYGRGDPLAGRALPEIRIEEDSRKVPLTARSRFLTMRYHQPRRYREVNVAEMPGLSEADIFLATGQADAAVRAYREEISAAPEPRPDAWTGLALATHQLATHQLTQSPLRSAFATRLPLMFDVHACLLGRGVQVDPMKLAGWLA